MDEIKFRVFVTNGDYFKEIFFITQKGEELFLGQVIPESASHWTYHKSGKRHFKKVELGETEVSTLGLKLKEFKGIEYFLRSSIAIKQIQWEMRGKEYQGRKFHTGVIVDERNYKEYIIISIFILEPKEFTLFQSLLENQFKNSNFILCTKMHPWVALIIHDGD